MTVKPLLKLTVESCRTVWSQRGDVSFRANGDSSFDRLAVSRQYFFRPSVYRISLGHQSNPETIDSIPSTIRKRMRKVTEPRRNEIPQLPCCDTATRDNTSILSDSTCFYRVQLLYLHTYTTHLYLPLYLRNQHPINQQPPFLLWRLIVFPCSGCSSSSSLECFPPPLPRVNTPRAPS
jgi:hypothetical protein